MNFNLIGAGRLGKNIALALGSAQIASLQAIYNRRFDSAKQACQALGTGVGVSKLSMLLPADVLWVVCSDDAIEPVVDQLAKEPILKKGSFVIHCSGVLNSSVLAPLKEQGCHVASMHPLKAFKQGYLSPDAFLNTYCVVEGDEMVCQWLHDAFHVLGAKMLDIQPKAKANYHAAACMASNYLITLASSSEQLMLNAGIPKEQAREMICDLMQGNIENLRQKNPIKESLTGPLMRGDVDTLNIHLQSIDELAIKKLYKAAGIATLPLTTLPDATQKMIEALLHDG